MSDFVYWTVIVLVGLFATGLTIATAIKRKGKGYYLCQDCKFNSPQDCLKVERPHALVCTSYRAGALATAPPIEEKSNQEKPVAVAENAPVTNSSGTPPSLENTTPSGGE